MNKSLCYTKNNYNMFEVSSLIQKSLRRRDARHAYFAANELLPRYRNYLWKRLFTVSAEDCFDMITHRVLELYEKDSSDQSTDKYVAMAVSTLLNARKNRDGDYFACNLFNSRDNADITKYVAEPRFDETCSTKNGHRIFDLAECYDKAMDAFDDVMAGYAVNELCVYYRNYAWDVVLKKARRTGNTSLYNEVKALKKVDEITKQSSTLYYSKAIVLTLKIMKGDVEFLTEFAFNSEIRLSDYNVRGLRMPEYVYDCHTVRGKQKGKTKREFIVEEQNSLVPRIDGMYDDSSWEHFLWLCDNGFYRADYTPRPPKERIKEIESLNFQPSLFDL